MFGPDGIESSSCDALFYSGRVWHKRSIADSTAEATLDVLDQVKALILDERFSQAEGVEHALRDLASTCDMFLQVAGARVSAVAAE